MDEEWIPILIFVAYFVFFTMELMYDYIKGRRGKKKGEEYDPALGPPRNTRDDP